MSDSIPPHLSTLTHPDTQLELLAYLREAANPAFWKAKTDVSFLIHFIFDDNDFRPAEQQIDRSLLNEAEASVLNAFVHTLNAAIGPRSKPLSALRATDWAPVTVDAATAQMALNEPPQ